MAEDFENHETSSNLFLINGTLVMAAIPNTLEFEHREEHVYIQTKDSFTYGRFEMRAVIPNENLLRLVIDLEGSGMLPIGMDEEFPARGRIDLNQNRDEIHYGIYFIQNKRKKYIIKKANISIEHAQFQTYIFDWTKSEIVWTLNKRVLAKFNITEQLRDDYNPFNNTFKLRINLSKDPSHYRKYDKWNCSLLILDYVRIYEIVQIENNERNVMEQILNDSDPICEHVMSVIKKLSLVYHGQNNGKQSEISISIYSSLILILIIITIILFRAKKLKRELNEKRSKQTDESNIELDSLNDDYRTEYNEGPAYIDDTYFNYYETIMSENEDGDEENQQAHHIYEN